MLSEEVIERIGERLSSRIESLNVRILEEIGQNIKKLGTLSYTDALRLGSMLKYGGSYEKITQEIAKATNLTVQDIEEIFKEVAKKDLEFAKQFYDYRGIDFVPYEENMVLQKQVQAISRLTIGEFLTNTTALGYGLQDMYGNVTYKGIKEAYSELIDKAVISISQGKETFEQSMYKQLKTLGGGGLRVIYPTTYVDKDGNVKNYTRRLDSVVRTQIEEGLRTLHNTTQEIYGNEFGANGVEVTHHLNAAPDHIDSIDGKQFALIDTIQNQIALGTEKEIKSNDIRGNQVRVKDKWYDDFNAINNSLERQVSTLNCRHRTFSIILGVSKPAYTQEQLDEDKTQNMLGFDLDGKHYTLYEGEQLQRKLETEVRKQKDTQILAKASDNQELIRDSQQRITELTYKYKELCDKSGLKPRLERMRVSGYKRTKVKMPNNYMEIEYARKNNQIWHSTENLEKIVESDTLIKPSISVGKEINAKVKYGTQFIEFKPELLENVNKNTILYRGDGGNAYSRKNKEFDSLMQLLKNKPNNYNELKFNNDIKLLKYIKKVYIRQDESQEIINLLKKNNIEYEMYFDYRERGFKRKN